jgi:hypothetical protein
MDRMSVFSQIMMLKSLFSVHPCIISGGRVCQKCGNHEPSDFRDGAHLKGTIESLLASFFCHMRIKEKLAFCEAGIQPQTRC